MSLSFNQVYCGDCLDVMQQIAAKSVDMVLCDLPYGTTHCAWDVIIPMEKLWAAYLRILKNKGVVCLFGTEPFSSYLRLSNPSWYKYDWYWNKGRGANFLFGNRQPLKVIETISVFYDKQPTYNPQKFWNPQGISTRHLKINPKRFHPRIHEVMGTGWKKPSLEVGSSYEPDKLLPKTLITFTKDTKRYHPTQKPAPLLEYLIRTYTKVGDLVLDNCAGSGSTGVAAMALGRDFLLIEKEEHYCLIAQERLSQ